MDKLSAAGLTREVARTSGTNAKLDRWWDRWEEFCEKIELEGDYFLEVLTGDDKVRILGAFAQAVRDREFSPTSKKDLGSSTCKEAVDKVAEVFRANNWRGPRHGENGTDVNEILKLQYKGYSNKDPATKQQKALTPSFYRHLFNSATTKKEVAIAHLSIFAFFYACRSCEYSKVQGDRKTKTITIKNIRFFSLHKELSHDHLHLANAERVTITFEDQKNDKKNVTIPHENNNNPVMNPVRALAATVQRILTYPGTSEESTICTFYYNKKLTEITSNEILTAFRSNATKIGADTLGFKPEDIGTHSNRSAAAMAMFLDDTPVFMIMLMGRWSSDAFLKYIRRQVLEFSKGISSRMIKNDIFYSIPEHRCNQNDPRTRNKQSFATNLSMIPSTGNMHHRPAFSLWH